MSDDEAAVHDFVRELLRTSFVGDAAYARVLERFGEQGVVDLTGTVGYFVAVCYVDERGRNAAAASDAAPLARYSTVTALARLRGLSTSVPRLQGRVVGEELHRDRVDDGREPARRGAVCGSRARPRSR